MDFLSARSRNRRHAAWMDAAAAKGWLGFVEARWPRIHRQHRTQRGPDGLDGRRMRVAETISTVFLENHYDANTINLIIFACFPSQMAKKRERVATNLVSIVRTDKSIMHV